MTGKKRLRNFVDGNASKNKKAKSEDSVMKTVKCHNVNNKRIRHLYNPIANIANEKDYVIYWMDRDQRVRDNWSLLYAQQRAINETRPLLVIFIQATPTIVLTHRKLKFIIDGLKEVQRDLNMLDIKFKLLVGKDAASVMEEVLQVIPSSILVCDFSPLRGPRDNIDRVMPLCRQHHTEFVQLDSHNIVPVWVTSEKQEHAARTIRPKIHRNLNEFLDDFPLIVKHPTATLLPNLRSEIDPSDDSILTQFPEVEQDLATLPDWCVPGYEGGMKELNRFCEHRLKTYSQLRNDPSVDGLSHLSIWFNSGQISVQRAILEVLRYAQSNRNPHTIESKEAFFEEAVVRRELSDNYCYYNRDYDLLKGAPCWAQITLRNHSGDERSYLYELKDFEKGRTHDSLWNAAQKEGEINGQIHGAKKILEWSKTPEDALRIGIYLNDKYNLDGGDPNGYVGVMWSIAGLHDQGWAERPIFGKIRYMNDAGCKRKFNVNSYISKWIRDDGATSENKKN